MLVVVTFTVTQYCVGDIWFQVVATVMPGVSGFGKIGSVVEPLYVHVVGMNHPLMKVCAPSTSAGSPVRVLNCIVFVVVVPVKVSTVLLL